MDKLGVRRPDASFPPTEAAPNNPAPNNPTPNDPTPNDPTANNRAGDGPHVLAVLYPAFGHVLPMTPILAELVRRGCRVTATTGAAFADRVRATGAQVRTYRTTLTDAAPPERLTADELAWRTLHHIEEGLAISPVLEACGRPDVLLYDSTLWAASRVLAVAWNCPAVQLVPTFASNEHFSVGERLARIAPPVDPAHPAMRRSHQLLESYATEHNVPQQRSAEVIVGQGHPNVVTVTREFQYFGDTFGEQHIFVGPCLETTETTTPDEWRPGEGGEGVALISLGTTVNEQPELFRECAHAFAGTGWQVVMTVGGRLDPASLGPLPPNVEVHQWLPHAQVLRHADVFVCQGGMGSVQESLYYAVPMVVVAHHHEQQANAERIAELGLGLSLDRRPLTAAQIKNAVQKIAATPRIRANTQEMAQHISKAGGTALAAETVIAHARR